MEDGCIRGSLISDPTCEPAQSATKERSTQATPLHLCILYQMESTRTQHASTQHQASLARQPVTRSSLGHSRVVWVATWATLLQYSQCFWSRSTPAARLRAKVITQLCTHGRAPRRLSIALFSPGHTSHMPSFQPSSERHFLSSVTARGPLEPGWARLILHPPAPRSSLKTSRL